MGGEGEGEEGGGGDEEEDEDEEEAGKTPKPVKALEAVTAIASGDNHSFAVVKGQLWGWGSGQWGRLGTGGQGDECVPVPLSLGVREVVRAVACGANHTVALTAVKAVWGWGWNKQGRVGVGKTTSSLLILTPTLIPTLSPTTLSSPITGITAGHSHTLAWTDAGGVFSWGAATHNCLGHGSEEDQWTPKGIAALQGMKVTLCAAGAAFSLAVVGGVRGVLVGGVDVYSWGSNRGGELGRKVREGEGVGGVGRVDLGVADGPSPITALACGKAHTVMVKHGVAYSWGSASRGVLGRGEGVTARWWRRSRG